MSFAAPTPLSLPTELIPRIPTSRPRRGARVPIVRQMQWSDCGAACLSMVLRYHGHFERLETIRKRLGVSQGGLNARQILDAGSSYGLSGRGLRVDIGSLAALKPATILHWEFNHFVVFEKAGKEGLTIIDPASGRRTVSWKRVETAFTGVALELTPTASFVGKQQTRGRRFASIRTLLAKHKTSLLRILSISILLRVLALSIPVFVGVMVDRVVPRSDHNLLSVAAIGFALVMLFDFLSGLIRSYLLVSLRVKMDASMTLDFLEHLVSLPYSFFQNRPTGDLLMRVNSNATIREILTSNTVSGLLDGVLVLMYLLIVLWVSPLLGAIAIAFGAVHLSVFVLSRRRTSDLMAEDLESQAKSQSYMVQFLGGIETLKASGSEVQAIERWSNLFARQLNVSVSRAKLSAWVDSIRQSVQRFAPVVILFVGAQMVMANEMSLGTMLAVNALAASIFGPLSSLVNSALQLQLLGSFFERIEDVVDNDREQAQGAFPPAHRLEGEVRLEGVSFQYSESDASAVDNIDLHIAPGTTVAIVGPSGCGKSTLGKLIAGLYTPTAGRVTYDGRNVSEMELRSLRRQLGVVPQAPYIFGSTIKENICLSWPGAEMHRVSKAAHLACIHDDIMNMNMGFDTAVADGGASLSGGQRQRIAIARAILTNPAVMILDEATSALDSETENRVARHLRGLHSTQIIIAHRLSTIEHADIIVVMDKGAIVESGTHQDLIARRGLYCSLVGAQDKGADLSVIEGGRHA